MVKLRDNEVVMLRDNGVVQCVLLPYHRECIVTAKIGPNVDTP